MLINSTVVMILNILQSHLVVPKIIKYNLQMKYSINILCHRHVLVQFLRSFGFELSLSIFYLFNGKHNFYF
jgi:hypothetical protein